MTRQERLNKELKQENEGLREEIRLIVESMRVCRYCKHLDADCSPGTATCKPEWRGLKHART